METEVYNQEFNTGEIKLPILADRKKSFFRRYWWIGIIVLLIISFASACIIGHKRDSNKVAKEVQTQPNSEEYRESWAAYDSSLPSCPANLSGILTHPVFDLSKIDAVMPLGMLSPGGHTIPTDHMYLDHFGTERLAIYAPGNITLIHMDDKITYDASNNQKIRDDYSIQFALCKGLAIYLNHFSEIEPKIKSAWENSNKQCESEQKFHFGSDRETYYQPCQSYFKLAFKAGELMGHIGTMARREKEPVIGIDLGAYNYNGTPNAFANPRRYSEDNKHAFCGIDLFSKDIKDAYYAKLGNVDYNPDSPTVKFSSRIGEPLCGATMQDVTGTLAGNWFAGAIGVGSVTQTEYMMALANTVDNVNILEISLQGQTELGGNTMIKFVPTHTGTINRQFSEVTPGEQVYCYQSTFNTTSGIIDANGKPKGGSGSLKYLIQLVDSMHLKIERQAGSCGASEVFSSPISYER